MDIIEKLRNEYEAYQPKLAYEGSNEHLQKFDKLPPTKLIDAKRVWDKHFQADPGIPSPDGYYIVDTDLDLSGSICPDVLQLPSEMQGQELWIEIYVDRLNCIHMRAIGGYKL
jgi:hypothetical protein